MGNLTIFRISSILALFFSLVGAILMVAFPWSYWWYSYEGGGYRYTGSGVVTIATFPYGIFIALVVIFLFICFIISLLSLLPSVDIDRLYIIISLIFAVISLIMIVIGAVITASIMAAEELYWTFGAAFYGGITGSIFTILFMLIMVVTYEKK